MKDDCTTNSHYLMHTFVFEKVGRMHFLNLGVKGLTGVKTIKGTRDVAALRGVNDWR